VFYVLFSDIQPWSGVVPETVSLYSARWRLVMSSSGTPEPTARRFGDEVARLRTKRGLSRARFISRLYALQSFDTSLRETISESLLRQIEEGTKVKITRHIIELFCLVLECNPGERLNLMIAADRNVLANSDGAIDPEAEVLLRAVDEIYNNSTARTLLKLLLTNKETATLNNHEIFEILERILMLTKAKRGTEE
jgi:transcriptional regulator with XRE-family HTH domain